MPTITITTPIPLIPQRSNHIPQRAQTAIDALRLLQALPAMSPSGARVEVERREPLAPREVNEVEGADAFLRRAITSISSGYASSVATRAHPPHAHCKHLMTARAPLVHRRARRAPPRARLFEELHHLYAHHVSRPYVCMVGRIMSQSDLSPTDNSRGTARFIEKLKMKRLSHLLKPLQPRRLHVRHARCVRPGVVVDLVLRRGRRRGGEEVRYRFVVLRVRG